MKNHELRETLGPCGYSEFMCMLAMLSKKFVCQVVKGCDPESVAINFNNQSIFFNPKKGWSLNITKLKLSVKFKNHIDLYNHVVSLGS